MTEELPPPRPSPRRPAPSPTSTRPSPAVGTPPARPAPAAAAAAVAAAGVDQTEAGREVVEALGVTPPRRLEPPPVRPVAPCAAPSRSPRRREAAGPAPTGRTTDVEFAPRSGLAASSASCCCVLLPLTAAAGYLAYDQRDAP